jgi:hypothetical protein
MTSTNVYRSNAEDCLRMANSAQDKHDRTLWITLAQSWLGLAELSTRSSSAFDGEDREPRVEQTFA